MSTRWLVTGAGGMLGRDLVDVLEGSGVRVTGLGRTELDITDGDQVAAAVAGQGVVVNAAGWTDVDGAESDEAGATRVNGEGVEQLARACLDHGAVLLHVSSDYVFDGTATAPYPEDAPTSPVNAYGRSKLAGERAVARILPQGGYTVRTAWLYGEHGRNFVSTMLRLANERAELEVVTDQRGQPTWSRTLAGQLVRLGTQALSGRALPGTYHGTAAGEATWYELAREVFALAGLDPDRIRPTTSAQFARPAARPAYSVLGHDRWAEAGLAPMPEWREMLASALSRPGFAIQ